MGRADTRRCRTGGLDALWNPPALTAAALGIVATVAACTEPAHVRRSGVLPPCVREAALALVATIAAGALYAGSWRISAWTVALLPLLVLLPLVVMVLGCMWRTPR